MSHCFQPTEKIKRRNQRRGVELCEPKDSMLQHDPSCRSCLPLTHTPTCLGGIGGGAGGGGRMATYVTVPLEALAQIEVIKLRGVP